MEENYNKKMEDFYQAILMLETLEECDRFFNDVCTPRELMSIAQRLQVAKLLKIKMTYSDIEAITGASTATISRVNRFLRHGAEGYELVLDELIQKDLNKED